MTMEGFLEHLMRPRSDDGSASRGQRAMAVTVVLTVISILIVAMRMYTRIGLLKLNGREDWSILVSLVFAITYLGLVISQYHFGPGRHSNEIPAGELKAQLKRLWAVISMYNASLAFTKVSILFHYLRIFPNYWFRIICYIVMGIVTLYSTWAIITGFVNCVPVAKFWDREIPGSCLSFEAIWFFNASMNIATDLILLVLPMPLISQLQLPKKQKLASSPSSRLVDCWLSPVSPASPVCGPLLKATTYPGAMSALPTGLQQSATSPLICACPSLAAPPCRPHIS
ncbi:PTH11-like integral membrane protein [Aspergillus lucknowensis]|uniref:Rhodopsin domain-containing protein n=1 Tax=Aspergillus lucknowensis TaxID=176173 RepID=A0ABR4LD02_9EURO